MALSVSEALSWLDTNIGVTWTTVVVVSIGVLLGLRRLYRINLNDLAGYREDPDGLAVARELAYRDPTAKYAELYRRSLQRLLEWLDARFGNEPWSAWAFDWCLRLALAYPIVGVFLVWAITGANTSGIPGLLPDDAGAGFRVLGLVGLAGVAASYWKSFTTAGWRSLVWRALVTAIAGVLAFSLAVGGAIAGVIAGVIVVAFAVAFAVAGAVAGAFAGVIAVAVAVALALTGALAVGIAGGVAGGVAVAVAGAVAFVIRATLDYLRISHGVRLLLAVCVLVVVLLAGTFGLGKVLAWGGNAHAGTPSLLVFLGALPVINAMFDWGSLGLTRHLLRQALAAERAVVGVTYGMIDAAAAFAILAALAAAIPAALTGLNALAMAGRWPEPLIDVAGRLELLRTGPGDPSVWWIYVMLFSTLLPGVVHIVIALAALVTVRWPAKWNRWYAAKLQPDQLAHGPQRRTAAAYLTLRQVAEYGLPVAALGAIAAILVVYKIVVPQLASGLLWLATTVTAAL